MEALRAKFLQRCEEDLVVVRAGAADSSFKLVIHRLAGVAPMFGFDALGQAALEIDDELCAGRAPEQALIEGVARALEEALDSSKTA